MLVEMVISVFLLAIALAMTAIIVGVLTKNVTATLNSGTSTDAAQSALTTLSEYLSGVVSPEAAAAAELQPYPTTPTTETSPCWGSGNVTSQQTNQQDGWSSTYSTSQLDQGIGVIYAHDFDIEFCGYGAENAGAGTLPNVYQIFVNTSPGSCTSSNYCPVDIVSYGSGAFSSSDYQPTSPSTAGTVVASIGQIWCDSACQTLGVACSSISAAAATAGFPTTSLPSNYSSLCPAGTHHTPPLFTYYANTGSFASGAATTALNWENAYTNSSTVPANVNTTAQTGASSPCLTTPVLCDGPLDLYSPDDAVNIDNVQTIVMTMTVLGASKQGGASQPKSVQITGQVWLRSLAS